MNCSNSFSRGIYVRYVNKPADTAALCRSLESVALWNEVVEMFDEYLTPAYFFNQALTWTRLLSEFLSFVSEFDRRDISPYCYALLYFFSSRIKTSWLLICLLLVGFEYVSSWFIIIYKCPYVAREFGFSDAQKNQKLGADISIGTKSESVCKVLL